MRAATDTDKLIEELGFRKSHVIVSPAIRDPRKARKKGEEGMQDSCIGEGTRPQAGAGQTGASRRRVRRGASDETQKGHAAEKHDAGEGIPPQPGAGETGAG